MAPVHAHQHDGVGKFKMLREMVVIKLDQKLI